MSAINGVDVINIKTLMGATVSSESGDGFAATGAGLDSLWRALQSGSYGDDQLFKDTTNGHVYVSKLTSEAFGGVLVPIDAERRYTDWSMVSNSSGHSAYFIDTDTSASVTSRGWAFDLTSGGTITKSDGSFVIDSGTTSGAGAKIYFDDGYPSQARNTIFAFRVTEVSSSSNTRNVAQVSTKLKPLSYNPNKWYYQLFLSMTETAPGTLSVGQDGAAGARFTNSAGQNSLTGKTDTWIYIEQDFKSSQDTTRRSSTTKITCPEDQDSNFLSVERRGVIRMTGSYGNEFASVFFKTNNLSGDRGILKIKEAYWINVS